MSDAKGYLMWQALAALAIFTMTLPYIARQKAREARQRQTSVLTAHKEMLERAVDLFLQDNRYDIARQLSDKSVTEGAFDVEEKALRPYLQDFLFEGDSLRRPKPVRDYRLKVLARCVESATPDGQKCDSAALPEFCRCVFYEFKPSAEIETELQPLDF